MDYPIVEVETSDKIPLFGLYLEAKNSKKILINIHGTASNFFENYYMTSLSESLLKKGISILSTNNRGASVMQVYPLAGAAIEHFEDCLKDIDVWIEFVLSKGYNEIILQGHSLGSEKVVYYMNKGKYREKIVKIILLGPADSWGYNYELLGKDKMKKLLDESANLVKSGKNEQFLSNIWLCHGGVLPKGADSFINFFQENSELSRALPLRKGKDLEFYQQIKVPILVAIGDEHEYMGISIEEGLKALRNENKLSKCYKLKNCNHDFEDKEEELTKLIVDFI
jgi:pimeloyl-ACP methyl ester carboxylesterase